MIHQSFDFKPLTEKQLSLLADWLSQPHLQKWWREDKISIEKVRDKYLPRILSEEDARPFLVYLDGNPIGYIQYYHAWINQAWWPDKPGESVLGIDQFIANEKQLNKGIGSKFISQFVRILMDDPKITEVRIDPRPDNLRAIQLVISEDATKSRRPNK